MVERRNQVFCLFEQNVVNENFASHIAHSYSFLDGMTSNGCKRFFAGVGEGQPEEGTEMVSLSTERIPKIVEIFHLRSIVDSLAIWSSRK